MNRSDPRMKADHRKELQTNVLADSMGRLIQGLKSGKPSTQGILWLIAVLALGTIALWYYAGRSTSSDSKAWTDLDRELQDNKQVDPNKKQVELAEISRKYPGTMASRAARFERARLLLPEGLRNLATFQRESAVEDLKEAHKLYVDLAAECRDEPLLVQEALMGAAQAAEALIGLPRDEKKPENSYKLEDALQLYQRLAKTYPDSLLGKESAEHAKRLEDNRAEVEKFYADLNKRATAAKP